MVRVRVIEMANGKEEKEEEHERKIFLLLHTRVMLITPSSTAFQNLPSETNFTVELWVYPFNSVNYGTNSDSLLDIGQTFQMEFDGSERLLVKLLIKTSAKSLTTTP